MPSELESLLPSGESPLLSVPSLVSPVLSVESEPAPSAVLSVPVSSEDGSVESVLPSEGSLPELELEGVGLEAVLPGLDDFEVLEPEDPLGDEPDVPLPLPLGAPLVEPGEPLPGPTAELAGTLPG